MGDAEHLQPSKKRVAGRQLTKDGADLDDEEISEQDMGTFKKASDEVLAGRRIVKVRRNTTAAVSSAPASANPFAGIQFPTASQSIQKVASAEAEGGKMALEKVVEKVNATLNSEDERKSQSDAPEAKKEPIGEEKETLYQSTETKSTNAEIVEGNLVDEKTKKELESDSGKGGGSNGAGEVKIGEEAEYSSLEGKTDAKDLELRVDEKDDNGSAGKSVENSSFSSFQQLSSGQNAFTGLAGTGFSSSTFSFGSTAKGGAGSGPLFGMTSDQPFGIGLSGNENTSLFGTLGSSSVNNSAGIGFPTKQEVSIETGEENEKIVFAADSVLFEFTDKCWKERGKGELKVNVSSVGPGKARLVMRTKGNYRLILNAGLYSDMKLTNMEKKGVTFACVNSASEGKDGLSTYAVKFKDPSIAEEFKVAVTGHQGQTAVSLKTPDNSPKVSDD